MLGSEIGFLDWEVQLQPSQYFTVDVANVSIDLSRYYTGQPTVNLVVNAEGKFDPDTGAIEWQFHALDPVTRQPPENPYAGFLPPITANGWEIGWVNFKPGAGDGVTLCAGVFFGMQAVVLRAWPAKRRVQILLDILGRPTPMEVDTSLVSLERKSVSELLPTLAATEDTYAVAT
jgi:hypothetical protein